MDNSWQAQKTIMGAKDQSGSEMGKASILPAVLSLQSPLTGFCNGKYLTCVFNTSQDGETRLSSLFSFSFCLNTENSNMLNE